MSPPDGRAERPGTVYIVGAGPGDPGLFTLRGRDLLRRANVVLYDRLVPTAILEMGRPDAEFICVGKEPGGIGPTQRAIEELLVRHAAWSRVVVRLKGGDPFLFGRGFEEVEACRQAGVPCVVVSGVSSALAAPAAAGIPLTDRRLARSVAILSAARAAGVEGGSNEHSDERGVREWAMSSSGGINSVSPMDRKVPVTDVSACLQAASGMDTVVILMGRQAMDSVTSVLIEFGRDPATPAAVIERGTRPDQRWIRATLGTISEETQRQRITNPMVLVVGRVAALAVDGLDVARGPLLGKTVVITRPVGSSMRLKTMLASLGAIVYSVPLQEIVFRVDPSAESKEIEAVRTPPDQRSARTGVSRSDSSLRPSLTVKSKYDWIAFTSAHGVVGLVKHGARGGKDFSEILMARKAVIGPATGRMLRRYGLRPDLVAPVHTGVGLAEAILRAGPGPTGRVLHPCSDLAGPGMSQSLSAAGWVTDRLVVYRTMPRDPPGWYHRISGEIDLVVFCSPSAVNQAMERGLMARTKTIACLGPVTADAVKRRGRIPEIVPQTQTMGGLVSAIVNHYQEGEA